MTTYGVPRDLPPAQVEAAFRARPSKAAVGGLVAGGYVLFLVAAILLGVVAPHLPGRLGDYYWTPVSALFVLTAVAVLLVRRSLDRSAKTRAGLVPLGRPEVAIHEANPDRSPYADTWAVSSSPSVAADIAVAIGLAVLTPIVVFVIAFGFFYSP